MLISRNISGLDWDDSLECQLVKCWETIIDDMKKTAMIQVSRCVFHQIDPGEIMSIDPHGFADASNVAYGANVYLRITSSGGVSVQLLA